MEKQEKVVVEQKHLYNLQSRGYDFLFVEEIEDPNEFATVFHVTAYKSWEKAVSRIMKVKHYNKIYEIDKFPIDHYINEFVVSYLYEDIDD